MSIRVGGLVLGQECCFKGSKKDEYVLGWCHPLHNWTVYLLARSFCLEEFALESTAVCTFFPSLSKCLI